MVHALPLQTGETEQEFEQGYKDKDMISNVLVKCTERRMGQSKQVFRKKQSNPELDCND